MQIEIKVNTYTNKVYWVTDNEGKRWLCHDPVYTQWLETKFRQEAKEKESENEKKQN